MRVRVRVYIVWFVAHAARIPKAYLAAGIKIPSKIRIQSILLLK